MRNRLRTALLPVVAVLVLAALAAPLSFGQSDEKDAIKGTVVSVNVAAGTFVIRDEMKKDNVAKETTFHLANRPRILISGKPAGLEDLKPGTEVKVAFSVDGKKRMAHTIETVEPKKSAHR